MIAEKAKADNDKNISPKFVNGNIRPYFITQLTITDTINIAIYVLKNQANQLTPGLKPIAFIVFLISFCFQIKLNFRNN